MSVLVGGEERNRATLPYPPCFTARRIPVLYRTAPSSVPFCTVEQKDSPLRRLRHFPCLHRVAVFDRTASEARSKGLGQMRRIRESPRCRYRSDRSSVPRISELTPTRFDAMLTDDGTERGSRPLEEGMERAYRYPDMAGRIGGGNSAECKPGVDVPNCGDPKCFVGVQRASGVPLRPSQYGTQQIDMGRSDHLPLGGLQR